MFYNVTKQLNFNNKNKSNSIHNLKREMESSFYSLINNDLYMVFYEIK